MKKPPPQRIVAGEAGPPAGGAGEIRWCAHRGRCETTGVTRIKKHIGVVPEVSNLYDELSAFDNLAFAMQLYGVPRATWRPRAEALLTRFRLSEKRDTPFAKLSR
jgi:ABC-type multidrug transport system ATPase subunit